MRNVIWFSVLVAFAAVACGCSSGSGPTAEDQAFEKQLEAAAAKHKATPGETKHTMKNSVADKAALGASSAPSQPSK
jgi:hypothetical protein